MQNQKGNIVLIIVGIIALLVIGGGVGYSYFITNSKKIIVNVKIDPPYQPIGNLSPDKRKEQETAIAESIDKIISDLDKNKYVYYNVSEFINTPGFAITISKNGYQYLLRHPSVVNIAEDKPVYAF